MEKASKRSIELQKKSTELQLESKRAGVSFLRTEVNVSLTFAKLALEAGDDQEKKSRDLANARKGYDTLMKFKERWLSEASEAERHYFEEKVAELEDDLKMLGGL